MGFSRYDKDRPFLVITQHTTPAKGENTSLKNWGKTGKKVLQEMVMIVDEVKNKHLVEATIIIDILQRRMVKSRFTEDDSEVLSHYLSQYKNQVAEGIQLWMGGKYEDAESTQEFVHDLTEEIDRLEELDNIKINVAKNMDVPATEELEPQGEVIEIKDDSE